MNEKLENSVNTLTEIDTDDAPELDDKFFISANLYHGNKLIRKGRPLSENPKQSTTIRLDADILEYFKSSGRGWQTRINNALREWIEKS